MKTYRVYATGFVVFIVLLWLGNTEFPKDLTENVVSETGLMRKAPVVEIFRRDSHLYDPVWIIAEDQHRLIIQDASNDRRKIYRYDLQTDAVISEIPVGNGPGELAARGMKWLSRYGEDHYFLYDTGSFRAYVYGSDLQIARTVSVEATMVNPLSMFMMNDSLLFSIPQHQDVFGAYYSISASTGIKMPPLSRISNQTYDGWGALRNVLLKNGHVLAVDGAVYHSFLFSSRLVKFGNDGVIWQSGTELAPDFPVLGNAPEIHEMPDVSKHAQQTLSLAVAGDRVYSLYSGKKPGTLLSLKTAVTGDFKEVDELVNSSDRLRIYNTDSGEFIEEWQLPVRARQISAFGKYLYVSAEVHGSPTIIAYEVNG